MGRRRTAIMPSSPPSSTPSSAWPRQRQRPPRRLQQLRPRLQHPHPASRMIRIGLALAAAVLLAGCGEPKVVPFKTVPISPFLGEPVLGDPDSPVEIIEYASTTCSHCWML